MLILYGFKLVEYCKRCKTYIAESKIIKKKFKKIAAKGTQFQTFYILGQKFEDTF